MTSPSLSLTPNARRVLEARYLMRDEAGNPTETPEGLFSRVAADVADAERVWGGDPEPWRRRFFEVMAALDFLPNSPTLMNAGRELEQLAACFVLPVEDSLDSIFETLKLAAKIHQSGGGTGFSFSRLRPRGDVVKTTMGVSSGPVSFLQVYDTATEHIKQGSFRRGANMGILAVTHPDVLAFVDAKREGGITNFNVSVGVTEEWFQAATAGRDYDLVNPRSGQAVARVNAGEVLDRIVDAAWATGDPGIVFLDRINAPRTNPTPDLGVIEATNPCVTGDTWVLTGEGPRRVEDLIGVPFEAVVHGRTHRSSGFFPTGSKPVFELRTRRGFSITGTADHPVRVVRRRTRWVCEEEWRALGDLTPDDEVVLHDHRGFEWPGPGTEEEGGAAGAFLGSRVLPAGALAATAVRGQTGGRRGPAPDLLEIEHAGWAFAAGFLRGWFDVAGHVDNAEVLVASSDRPALGAGQRMLARLGILSALSDGSGLAGSHRLTISGANLARFRERVGFTQPAKAAALDAVLSGYRRRLNRERFVDRVASVAPVGIREVYDCRVEGVSSFDGNGLVVHNCGEQPLLPFEACVLGSVNLANFAAAGEVDWERLGDVVAIGVRFLDDAVERSHYPVPEIEQIHRHGNRKIGLGVMGWADLLVRLGLRYDSDEAVSLAERVMGFIQEAADAASEALAGERGAFPNWETSVYGPEGWNRPMRNATRTTVAPTGTISIIAGCSSGIEPLFALVFHRKVLDGGILAEVNPDFEKAARAAGIWSDAMAERVAEAGGLHGLDGVPESLARLFVTAHEVEPVWHVRHQAAFQRHVDNAVSKTINLPRHATREDVREVYVLAWQLGCKGITVYRDGSKTWQVLNRGRPSGTDLGTVEGSAPWRGEDMVATPPRRGQSVLEVCPVCGQASFEFAEACGKCHACGHSTC